MKLELNSNDVGIVLGVLGDSLGYKMPFPTRPRDHPDRLREIKRVYNKINKQGKAWLKSS